MGTSRSFAELGAKFDALAIGVGAVPREATKECARVAKTAFEVASPKKLRGVGGGAELGVAVAVTGSPEAAEALVYSKGPWQLIERDTRPHLIIPKNATGLGASRRARHKNARNLLGVASHLSNLKAGFGAGAVLKIGGHFAAYAHHPGTRGQHPWEKTSIKLKPILPRIYQVNLAKQVRRIF